MKVKRFSSKCHSRSRNGTGQISAKHKQRESVEFPTYAVKIDGGLVLCGGGLDDGVERQLKGRLLVDEEAHRVAGELRVAPVPALDADLFLCDGDGCEWESRMCGVQNVCERARACNCEYGLSVRE